MDAGQISAKVRKKITRAPKWKCPQVSSRDPDVHHCNVCGKDIKYLASFREHQRIHTGERPYQCKRCCKTFTRCADLIKHRLVHSATRPYRCKVCGKRFKLQADLDKHGKVHSDDAPFPCHLCPKRFKRTSCLVKHLRIHTHPHTGETLCMRALQPALQVGGLGQGARAGPHGGAAPPVQPVLQNVHSSLHLPAAPAHPSEVPSLQLQALLQGLQP
ncbi:PREDICTED: zinc finger protein 792-like [Gekko japonicus]|uniref:Zinc finger protein 792-like n=1 Tax=Gekko japonicus TaxID=146911 RepID=A0ABM1JZ23_GEKJA|nr:PREDICTED: zinc finger protein 792-like [Gekko japonicus]